MIVLLNLIFGFVPTMAFLWSLAAADESEEDSVGRSEQNRRRHRQVFALIYGLWCSTLAMWNWMGGAARVWVVLWIACAAVAFTFWFRIRARPE